MGSISSIFHMDLPSQIRNFNTSYRSVILQKQALLILEDQQCFELHVSQKLASKILIFHDCRTFADQKNSFIFFLKSRFSHIVQNQLCNRGIQNAISKQGSNNFCNLYLYFKCLSLIDCLIQLFCIRKEFKHKIMRNIALYLNEDQTAKIIEGIIETFDGSAKNAQFIQTLKRSLELKIENQNCRKELERVKLELKRAKLMNRLMKKRNRCRERRRNILKIRISKRLLRETLSLQQGGYSPQIFSQQCPTL